MKFPSLKNLRDSFESTVRRFPFELLFALAGTVGGILYINNDSGVQISESIYTRIMMTANLGLLLSLSATLFAESKGSKKWPLRAVIAIVAGCLLFIFNHELHLIDVLRFLLLSLAFHLLVAFAAFTAKGQVQGFWQFNKSLFLRFLTSGLYSGVLYLGLAAAIGASTLLFNLNIHDKTYATLFACIAGVFNTVFFLAGVPADTAGLESDDTYPKGLKVFTQYVLIPLASVYVIILLAYEVKILIQWNLPKGMVSNLILGYAVFGILSILLIYPLRNHEDNKWIKTYSRSFYFLLIPLIVLLFLAIASRILPYGVTEMRYFLIVLALWLMFITAYFLLSRKQNIKIIPISLCVVALLSVYGPQSAFSVSGYSQRHILVKIFKKYGAVKDEKLVPLKNAKMSEKDGKDAYDRVQYFTYNNNINGLQPCIDKNLGAVEDSIKKAIFSKLPPAARKNQAYFSDYESRSAQIEWVTGYLGLTKFNGKGNDGNFYYNFNAKNKDIITVKSFDYMLGFNNGVGDVDSVYHLKAGNIQVVRTANTNMVHTLYLNDEKVSFNVKAFADSLVITENQLQKYKDVHREQSEDYAGFTVPDQLLTITKQTAHFKVVLKIQALQMHRTNNSGTDVNSVEGWYLISERK